MNPRLDGAIAPNMERVFEGTPDEMLKWLLAGSPDYTDLFLISVAPDQTILTVSEYLELRIGERLEDDKKR